MSVSWNSYHTLQFIYETGVQETEGQLLVVELLVICQLSVFSLWYEQVNSTVSQLETRGVNISIK